MTLQAHLESALRFQLRGIDDRSLLADMEFTRSVAALAIDALGNTAVSLRRVAVVAEEARIRHVPAEIRVIWPVVTGTHVPRAAVLGIPTDRQFGQLSFRALMEEGFGMGAGTNSVVNPLF